jgi:hypothetical protein
VRTHRVELPLERLRLVEKLFRRLGLLDRLTVVSPRTNNRINFFGKLIRIAPQGGVTEELVGALSSLIEIEQRTANKSAGEDSGFFKTHAMQVLAVSRVFFASSLRV